MPRATRFEELEAWKRARSLTKQVYSVSSTGRFAHDQGLSRQVQRAGVSIMSNIAEGFERYRLAEFHQFLSVAKASCAELRSQLFVARDLEYIDEVTFKALMADAEAVGRLIGALRASISDEVSRAGLPGPRNQLREDAEEYISRDSGLRTQD